MSDYTVYGIFVSENFCYFLIDWVKNNFKVQADLID